MTIPLAEVRAGSLSLPVSLAYSYTGMQVYQPRDLVGLGWSLQAGASISLQVNGRLDLASGGPTTQYNPDSVAAPSQLFLQRVTRSLADSGPDFYSFSLPGGPTGKFIIRDTAIVLLPQQRVHIRRIYNQPGTVFQIATEQGVRYQFRATEQTHTSQNFGMGTYTSVWHLTHIISADNADTIRFHYTQLGREPAPSRCVVTTGTYHTGVEMVTVLDPMTPPPPCTPGQAPDYTFTNVFSGSNQLSVQYLDSITVRGTHLLFLRATTSHVLQQVRLLSTSGGRKEIKRVNFYQSSFGPASASDVRVRLDSLREGANGLTLPAYRFTYNTGADIPERGSAALDYWGYSNGAIANGSVASPLRNCLLADPLLGASQAQREPNFTFAVAGALEQVIYPTGGSSRWEYEPNQIWYEPGTFPPGYAQDSIQIEGPASAYDATNPRNIITNSVNGTRYATPSDTAHFQVPPYSGGVTVYLNRMPYNSQPGNNSHNTNLYKDFDIWRCLPTGDTLVTTSAAIGAYKSYDPATGTHFKFQLATGTYAIRVYCEQYEAHSSVRLQVYDGRAAHQQAAGGELPGAGIRVRRTKTVSAGAPALIRLYEYMLPDSLGGHGSGVALTNSRGVTTRVYKEVYAYDNACVSAVTSSDNSKVGEEFFKYPFFYSCVTVRDSVRNGSTSNYYSNYGYAFNDVLLCKKQVFEWDGLAQKLIQQDEYEYVDDTLSAFPFLRAYMTQRVVQGFTNTGTASGTINNKKDQYAYEAGLVGAAFLTIKRTRQYRFAAQDKSCFSSTRSYYRQQRLTGTSTRTSTGWHIQRFKYLHEYAPTSAVTALRVNSFNPLIETQTWHRNLTSPDSVLLNGTVTLYNPTWRSPARQYQLQLTHPQSGPNQETVLNGRYTNFLSDSRYAPIASIRYAAASGEPIQQQAEHELPTSYLTGYDHNLVIARAKNAAFEQIAATSFEPASTGRWQYDSTGTHQVLGGRTGHYAYRLDGTVGVVRSKLPAGDYEVLYWAQGVIPTLAVQNGVLLNGGARVVSTAANNWTQYSTRLRLVGLGQFSLNGPTGRLDEVRLYPIGAQLTSYTHDPLVGMTSQTGPDGRTLTYEYDGLGRLVRTCDEQGRILGQQQYHYVGQ